MVSGGVSEFDKYGFLVLMHIAQARQSILFLFYMHFLVFVINLLPQFWSLGHEIFSICRQWYEDLPQERIFGSHPHSRLQAQKVSQE